MRNFIHTLYNHLERRIFWYWLMASVVIFSSIIFFYVVKHNQYQGTKTITINTADLATIQGFVTDSVLIKKDTTVHRKIFEYLADKYAFKAKDKEALILKFKKYPIQQVPLTLTNYPLHIDSYFWLTEPLVYLEIIAWSLFGLLCSILYNVSEAIREKGLEGFKTSEVPVHIAKIFYAPICAIVIYFSFNVLTSNNDISTTNFNNGTIVLFFILGFFSGRTIDLLNKIKDIILPLGKNNDPTKNEPAKPAGIKLEGKVSFDPSIVVPANANLAESVVKLQSKNEALAQNFETSPDAEGKYILKNIPAGDFSLTAELKISGETEIIYNFYDNLTIEADTIKDIILKGVSEQN